MEKILIDVSLVVDLDNGNTIGVYARGHYLPNDFLMAAALEWDRNFNTEEVKHEYWRAIPHYDGFTHISKFVQAKPGTRGAFPVTFAGENFAR